MLRYPQEAKQLRDENTRLRKLVADLKPGQGYVVSGDCKKRVGLVDQRSDARWLLKNYIASERRVKKTQAGES